MAFRVKEMRTRRTKTSAENETILYVDVYVRLCTTHTNLFVLKGSNNKKTKKKKRNKPLQDKSNTTGQHNSILGLIFSTQSTNDIIGYVELAQKIRFSVTYAHRRQRKIKHIHAAGRNFFGSSIEYFRERAYNYIFQRLKVGR